MDRRCFYCIQGNCRVHIKNKIFNERNKYYEKNKNRNGKVRLDSSDSESSDSEDKKINIEKLMRNIYPRNNNIIERYHPSQINSLIFPQQHTPRIVEIEGNYRQEKEARKFDVNEIVNELLEKNVNPDMVKQIINDIIKT